MRFWIKNESSINFYYEEENNKEICNLCTDNDFVGTCAKQRHALRKWKEQDQFIFCFPKNVVSKQAKFEAKMTAEAFHTIYDAVNKRQTNLSSFESLAIHNAKKMSSSIGQKIDKIISEDELLGSNDKVALVEERITKRKNLVAREILNVRKTIDQIEAEYNLLEAIELDRSFSDSDLVKVGVHKLIVSAYYLYEDDFKKRNIKVDINVGNQKIKVEYSAARAAIGQIFSNAQKYCKKGTTISVSFENSNPKLSEIKFEMNSLYFSNEEAKTLTQYGIRGSEVARIKGDGYGLFAAEQFMKRHKGYLKMKSNENIKVISDGKPYSWNEFILGFNKF